MLTDQKFSAKEFLFSLLRFKKFTDFIVLNENGIKKTVVIRSKGDFLAASPFVTEAREERNFKFAILNGEDFVPLLL